MTELIARPMVWLLGICYQIVGGYVGAIALFTLLTKVILFPISLWSHINSLKIVSLLPEINRLKLAYYGDKERIGEEQAALYKRERYHPLLSLLPLFLQIVILAGMVAAIHTITDTGASTALGLVPAEAGGWTLLAPAAAGLAALALGQAQNRINPLQREQSRAEQWTTNGISIAISLSLGAVVALGVAIYWICSNLFSILNQLVCNLAIPPEKRVDYTALRESQRDLAAIDQLGGKRSLEEKKREKADYKRFFSIANKHLVFYSEKSGFYKYFQDVMEYLLAHSNITIHYITSDPDDQIFEIARQQNRIQPYYIGERRLITLMMKMDADMVVMTMPDLDTYHIKRSYLRKDIEYVYMFHGLTSFLMVGRPGCLNHYDTIFCIGRHQVDELRFEEQLYHLPPRRLVECGYGLLERNIAAYEQMPFQKNNPPTILIAPSWQEGNLLDICLEPMLRSLAEGGYNIIIRPHPEYIKRYPVKMERLFTCCENQAFRHVKIETDFSSNATVYQADILITDWSSIAHEFSYTTKRPSLFVNTPPKILNPDYEKYPMQPLDITLRQKIGVDIELDKISDIGRKVADMLLHQEGYRDQITDVVEKYVYHLGDSGKIGAQYIIRSLKARQPGRREERA